MEATWQKGLADDASGFVLVDGVRFAGIRKLVVCTGQATARTWLRRSAGNRRGTRLRLFDVSGVPGLAVAPHGKTRGEKAKTPFWEGKFVWVSVAAVLLGAGLGFGLTRLDTDPSLLDYFKKGQQPREGLAYIDQNGGSNPLTLVIRAADNGKLDTKEEYENMWGLQDTLQDHKGVGTVLSLPVLMDEAHRHPLAFLLSWNHLLNILNEPKHARVASSFVTKDRKLAAFYLRMEEEERTKPRVEVVDDLRTVVRKHGFRLALVGGVILANLFLLPLLGGAEWKIWARERQPGRRNRQIMTARPDGM
jgi:hypothetical protein